ESAAPPSIGRPIDGARAVLLDPLGRRVPAGVPGELAIGGPGLARGYLGRPDLTAERFVPDPFSGRPGERLYLTGDLARLLPSGVPSGVPSSVPSGELAFLGRSDRQIKIRGHRVEPAEAEAALLLHPGVREAVVDAVPGADGLALAAWIAPRTAAPEELEAFLLERLPAPWVPRTWVFLDALPLTPNGKVDRRALPAPSAPERTAAVAPRDAVELALARIWEELLGRPAGVTDHFFDLGGHSLLAIRLAARIRERFGRDLPLGALLAAPTLEQQAALLRQEGPLSAGILVPLRTGTGTRPLFLVHAAGGNALCYLDLARRLEIDRPVYGLQSPGLAGEVPPGKVEEMAARYVREVRVAQPEGPYLLGGWSSGGVVAFEMARQLVAAGEEVERVILIDSLAPDGDGELDEAVLRGLFGVEVPGERDGDGLFEMFRTHVQAVRSYEPRPLAAPVLLVRGAQPPAGRPDEPSLGWSRFAQDGIEVLRVPGNHHGLLSEPHVGPLSEALRTALAPLVSRSAGR
ncbi:MAG TPA: thioesterase domain-containing protein, partial [Thermoanaerobaculia bacterium]